MGTVRRLQTLTANLRPDPPEARAVTQSNGQAAVLTLRRRASSSPLSNRTGCEIGSLFVTSLVVVDDLHVVGITLARLEVVPPELVLPSSPTDSCVFP